MKARVKFTGEIVDVVKQISSSGTPFYVDEYDNVYRENEIEPAPEAEYHDKEDELPQPMQVVLGAIKEANDDLKERIKRNDIEFWRYARLNLFSIYTQKCGNITDAVTLTSAAIDALVKEQDKFEKRYK